MDAIMNFIQATGFYQIATGNWKVLIMMFIAFALLYLAIVKKFEPLLLLPIAFGMLITNLPGAEMYHEILFAGGHVNWEIFGGTPISAEFMAHLEELGVSEAVRGTVSVGQSISVGLIDVLYLGVKLGIYPCLIFMGVGAGTDFGPLIANPKTLLLGAAAQLGIFMTYAGCRISTLFDAAEASSIGIIGGADGPTAIFVTSRLAPHLLGPIAVAAYSYMALVPVIQPPIIKLLTTPEERVIKMEQLREVSKTEKIIFPIVVTLFTVLLLPSAGALIGMLMLGNLLKESGRVPLLVDCIQKSLMYIVSILLGLTVGAKASAEMFLRTQTLQIIVLGVIAFGMGTAGGVLLGKVMCKATGGKINPMIGAAGVSAVPMAARVVQKEGQKYNPSNFLLMHAMGPNVAGVIGSAVAAGMLLLFFQ